MTGADLCLLPAEMVTLRTGPQLIYAGSITLVLKIRTELLSLSAKLNSFLNILVYVCACTRTHVHVLGCVCRVMYVVCQAPSTLCFWEPLSVTWLAVLFSGYMSCPRDPPASVSPTAGL